MRSRTSVYRIPLLLGICFFMQSNAQLTNLDYDKLVRVKNAIKNGDVRYVSAYKKLISQADEALDEGPFSVLQKKLVAASGDKHDYLSLAPYWWPDLEKEDGLPWIRKDGIVNPMTKGDNVDDLAKDKMVNNVKVLSLAYFFTGKKRYARKVNELLKVWFLDEATRMNPNLNYAQGIPGKNTGRGFGIIEFSGVVHIINAIEFLELKYKLPKELGTGLRLWLSDYLTWLQTSEFGIFEKTRSNNHGSLYDAQLVSLLLFFDRKEEAKSVLNSVFKERIAPQIESDGSQPHELKRTKGLTYSILNLSALNRLAFYGKKVGVDIWGRVSAEGDMQKAYNFLYPYLDEKNNWPHEQLGSMEKALERLRRLFVNSGSMLEIPRYCNIAAQLKDLDDTQQLMYPCIGE
ncbi:alginate lyase family protein [Croceivirga lutea]|uniref:alginate lyase family protein n=1 Tax=Croceivirga lutea TaxID=1775167 RepID=UPI00163AB5CD|nr:alginate lyase family protein [Croceivirga lutea]